MLLEEIIAQGEEGVAMLGTTVEKSIEECTELGMGVCILPWDYT